MRKILFLFFGVLIIVFSCKKKSDDTSANIVGTWTLNKIVTLEYADGIKDFGDTTTQGNLIFNSNGTYTETDSSSSDAGKYSYISSTKKLTIASTSGDPETFTVTSLTSSNLHFTLDSTEVDGGITYRTTLDADFKR